MDSQYSPEMVEQARHRTREMLKRSGTFAQLPSAQQLSLYKEVLNAQAKQLSGNGNEGGLALAQARRRRPPAPRRASDLIDEPRHENKNIDKLGDVASDFVEAVDFPGFVRDLLKAVFDANLAVTIQQMETYQKLLKSVTKSISHFVNAIDDTAAIGYLAENQGDDFSISLDDEEKNENGSDKVILTDKEGNKLDLGDNEIKAKIMDAKIAMAKEQRALLRETILMGITRLVVEKGTIKAGVIFDIKMTEDIQRKDKAGMKEQRAHSATAEARTGFLTNLVGGGSGGTTHSYKRSQISVSTTESKTTTDLSAKLTGSVEIIFKSDYFKLDNFATMYGPQPAAAGGAPAPGTPAPGG